MIFIGGHSLFSGVKIDTNLSEIVDTEGCKLMIWIHETRD